MGTTTALSATLTGYRSADKPTIIPANYLRNASAVKLRYTSASHTAADQSSTSYPKAQIYDNLRATQGRTSAVGTSGYLLVDLGASPPSVDCMVIEAPLQPTDTVAVQCSDTLDGAGLLNGTIVTVQVATALDATRLVLLWSSSYAYRYWTLTFTTAGNVIRGFRQVWLGEQHQLAHAPLAPFDYEARRGLWAEARTPGGFIMRTQLGEPVRYIDAQFPVPNSAQHAVVRDIRDDCDAGASPMFLIYQPNSAPNTAIFGHAKDATWETPTFTGGGDAEALWRLTMDEAGSL